MSDLLVIGFDLATCRVVDIGERKVWEWHKKGHNGDRSLVCWLCYLGVDGPGGGRPVAPVPRGRKEGRRRSHFAHPPGVAPGAGQHMPETVWHYTAKHRLRAWAETAGADSARVEEYTRDGRRRSDVAITMPGGDRVVFEVQQDEITDREWLNRQRDYNRNGVAVSWIWRPGTWIPQVIYESGQPGWVFELDKNRIGLVCGKAHESVGRQGAGANRFRSAHWPPCPGDDTEIRWMPLRDVRLSPLGLQPSSGVVTQLSLEAADSERKAREATAPRRRPIASSGPPPATSRPTNRTSDGGRPRTTYLVQRIDGKPPWAEPEDQLYYCPACGHLTGVELRESPIPHEVAGPDRIITVADLQPHRVAAYHEA